MNTRNKFRSIAMMTMGLTVAATLAVPVAAAAHPTCQDGARSVVCQTNGSVAIKAVPEAKGTGNTDPGLRVGSQGRRGCYTQGANRGHICQY